MDYSGCCDNKWEKEVKCKKSDKGGVIYGKSSSNSLDQFISDVRNSGKEVSNNCCASKGYLSSG